MSAYRKIYVDGVRMFVVREATRWRPIGVYACRASLLPIGVECHVDRGWAVFDVEVTFREGPGIEHAGPPESGELPRGGVGLELDDLDDHAR